MDNTNDFFETRRLIAEAVNPLQPEHVLLSGCIGRVLYKDHIAGENIPPFDRSPLDGYAFCSYDVISASENSPAILEILEEIPAGGVPHVSLTGKTAVKILTGAPVPPGADAVSKYEETEFTEKYVKIFRPFKAGENIIPAGDDVRAGEILASAGDVIDPAVAGTLASQGVASPFVYRKPLAGIISTGNEIVEVDRPVGNGKIRNSNRYTLEAACKKLGCDTVFIGIARDSATEIAALIMKGLSDCDIIFLTGGVSVGDYDMTPAALEMIGAKTLVRNVSLKPGGACVYGLKNDVLICGLSGNPASSMTNFYALASSAIKRLCGRREYIPREITLALAEDYPHKNSQFRLVRGILDLSDGTVRMHIPKDRRNAVLRSLIGCDVMAIVPPDKDNLSKGSLLKGFLI